MASAVMMADLVTDPKDPRLTHGVDSTEVPQAAAYLVLSKEERAKGYVRPVRQSYVHALELGGCGALTTMSLPLAQTYARDPHFYGATYCVRCRKHLPVGEHGEFVWDGPYDPVTGRYTSPKVGT